MWWPRTQNGQHAGQVFVSLTILVLAGFSSLVMASGSFEIKVIKLNFAKESRCMCDANKSNIKVSVCLSHHLLPPPPDPLCTLGEAIRNRWSTHSPPIEIPFSYTWSGRFTLSVRASCQCQTDDKTREVLVSQLVLAHTLNPSRVWTSVSTTSPDLNSIASKETMIASLPVNEDSKQTKDKDQKLKTLKPEEQNMESTYDYDSEMEMLEIDSHSDRINIPDFKGKNPRLLKITKSKQGPYDHQRLSGDLWSRDPMPLTLSGEDNENHVARDVKDSHSNDTFLAHQNGTMTLVLRVTCQQYYYGNGCVLYCKPRDDFVGHFRCSDEGSKICLPGWKGKGCTQAVCPSKCLPSRGRCLKPFTCTCLPGWHGQYCEKCQTSRGCHKGYCHKPAQCLCQKGWTGPECDKEIDYEQLLCQHGGTRQQNKTCLCTPGHTGMFCEFSLCQENICLNKGICLISPNGPYCKCLPPFGGLQCQHNYNGAISHNVSSENNISCANPDCTPKHETGASNSCDNVTCLNNGTCQVSNVTKGPFCKCVPFFVGRHCETLLDPCVKNPCKNRGKCVTVANNAMTTVDGMDMGVNVTAQDSHLTIKCKCRRGFVGKRCHTRKNNNKHSKRKKCGSKCKKNKLPYILNEAEYICQNGVICQNGGTCIPSSTKGSFSCRCKENWTGEFCEIDETNPCASQVCLNGGRCRVKSKVPHCICPSGYAGHYCENPVSLCTKRTCRNGGICIESKGQFFCVCKRNYLGKFCERTWHSQGIRMPFTLHISYSKSDSCRTFSAYIVILCLLSIRIVL